MKNINISNSRHLQKIQDGGQPPFWIKENVCKKGRHWRSNSFYMTFVIFGCILHDTNLILVSILTNSRSVISNKPKVITWPWQLTFKIKVKLTIVWPSSFVVVYTVWYRLDLRVNFIVFDATDIADIKIFHLISKDDLENQGLSYLLWPLVHHGLYTWYRHNVGVYLNISDVWNLNMTNICHLTSIVDLENQDQTYF